MIEIKKMIPIFLFIFSLSLIETVDAAASNFLKVDLDNFQIKREKGEFGLVGSTSFHQLRLLNDGMLLNLNNSGEIFNSEIILKPSFLGFKGKAHSFGFEIPVDSGLFSIVEVDLNQSSIYMNELYIDLNVDNFLLSQEDEELNSLFQLDNLSLFCNKHPDHPELYSLDSFLYGCLSRSFVRPSVKGETTDTYVELEVELRDVKKIEELEALALERFAELPDLPEIPNDVKVYSRVREIEFKKDKVNLDTDLLDVILGEEENFSISLIKTKGDCDNYEDIQTFTPMNLVNTCLDNLKVTNQRVELQAKDLGFNAYFNNNSIKINEQELGFNTSQFALETPNFNLKVNNASLLCTKNTPFKDLTEDVLIEKCANDFSMKAFELDGTSQVFSIDFSHSRPESQSDPELSLTGNAVLEEVIIDKNNLKLKGQRFFVNFNDEYKAGFNYLNLFCAKDYFSNKDSLGTDSDLVSKCLNDLSLTKSQFGVEDIVSKTEYVFDLESFNTGNNKLEIKIPRFLSKDLESQSFYKNTFVSCSLHENSDLLSLSDVVKNCLKDGQLRIKESKSSAVKSSRRFEGNQPINGNANLKLLGEINKWAKEEDLDYVGNPTIDEAYDRIIKASKTSFKNLEINILDNVLKFSFKTKVFLLGQAKVKLKGSINFNEEEQKIVFELKRATLPFGINSNKITMYLLKKYLKDSLPSDRLEFRGRKVYYKL